MSEEEDKNEGASGGDKEAPGAGANAHENANQGEAATTSENDNANQGEATSQGENDNANQGEAANPGPDEGAKPGEGEGGNEGAKSSENEGANQGENASAGDDASPGASAIKRALVLMFKMSFVVKGIENKLTEMGYAIIEQIGKFNNIGNWQNLELCVLYLSEGIVDDPRKVEAVSQICQSVRASKIPMIVIGEWNRHDALSQAVPAIDWFRWLNRPIDIEAFAKTVKLTVAAAANGEWKKRILIVDDDPYYAKLVRDWVRESYRADVFSAGMQAFNYLLKKGDDDKVDLILLDYEMPVVDGPQVLQMLRQEPRTAHIPVVFLTGVGTKEAVMRVKGLRPDGYILKSTSKEALLDYLKAKLEG